MRPWYKIFRKCCVKIELKELRYMILCEFKINGISYVTVRLKNSAHVMPKSEWKHVECERGGIGK